MKLTSITIASGRSPRRSGVSARASRPSSETTRVFAARRGVELSAADVDRNDLRRAARQEHVGEASGRGADVEADEARRIEREGVERRGELDPAARRPRMGRLSLDRGILGHLLGRLLERGPANADQPGRDRGLRARPARKEAALDEKNIRALAHRNPMGWGVFTKFLSHRTVIARSHRVSKDARLSTPSWRQSNPGSIGCRTVFGLLPPGLLTRGRAQSADRRAFQQ